MAKATITWSVTAEVTTTEGKESYKPEKTEIQVDANGGVRKTIPRKQMNYPIEVQPSRPEQIEFFLIVPMAQGKAKGPVEGLKYSVRSAPEQEDKPDQEDDQPKKVPLTGVQLFTSGAAHWFDGPPKTLWFSNESDADIDVLIVVGRQVHPES